MYEGYLPISKQDMQERGIRSEERRVGKECRL